VGLALANITPGKLKVPWLAAASDKAKTQHERFEALLAKRGGTPSEGKTLLAEMLAFTPLSAQSVRVQLKRTHSI